MNRRILARLLPLALAILAAACSETLVEPEPQIEVPEALSSTVDDSLLFVAHWLGDPDLVARVAWDFQSDGIFDEITVSTGRPIEVDSQIHAFRSAGDYLTTVQVTTVQNRMHRSTIDVNITDELPVLEVSVPERLACGESALLSATVIDDAGNNAWWDLGNDGSPDLSATFTDTLTLETEYAPEGSGIRPVLFAALDNDGHRVDELREIIVGLEPEWPAELDTLSAMSEGRWGHSSVVYDGRIYVFGGRSDGLALSSVEAYDPLADTWTTLAPMPTPRWLSAAYVQGDSVYVMGGYLQDGRVFMTLETYHPGSDSWRVYDPADATKILPEARVAFGVDERREEGNEGFLLAFGGSSGGEIPSTTLKYRFDPGTWTYDYTNSMRDPRRDMAVVTVGERTYAIGGSEDGASPSAAFEHFNPAGILWVRDPEMSTARRWPAAAVLEDHIYVFGGTTPELDATRSIEIFDLLTGSWYEGPSMGAPRSGATAHALEGRVYVVGGRSSGDEGHAELMVLRPWRCEE